MSRSEGPVTSVGKTAVGKAAFWIIFGIVFLDLVGFGIVFPLLPLYARYFQVNEFQIGLVLGVYSLMQFIFAPILGKISDKVGRRPVLLVSMLGTALSFFMLAFSTNFWWFFVARALDGIAGSNLATAQAYIADISPKAERTRNMGMWIGAAFGLGFAFGPFIGGGLHTAGLHILSDPDLALKFPFLAAGALGLINLAFAWFKLPESLKLKDSDHSIGRRTFSLSAIKDRLTADAVGPLIITYAVVILAFSQMEATFTWLSHDIFNFSSIAVYALFGYLGIVMALVQGGLVRRLAPKMGDRNLALVGCILMVISLAAMPVYHTHAWLIATSGLLAIGHSFANPALISSISKGAHDALQGETIGVAQSLASLSRFVGPVTAGYFYKFYGPSSPYFISACIVLITISLLLYGYTRLSAQETTDQAGDRKEPLSV